MQTPFVNVEPDSTANTYGVDPKYDLGRVQTWNVDLSHDLGPNWNVGGGYTRTTGSSLDIVRAPNRGPSGLRIAGVQPFLWQTSEGASVLNAGTFRLQRRMVKGIGGGVTYTLAEVAGRCVEHRRRGNRRRAERSGSGGRMGPLELRPASPARRRPLGRAAVRPQQALAAQRRTLGPLFGDWRGSAKFTWQSGTPFTPRVTGAASDVVARHQRDAARQLQRRQRSRSRIRRSIEFFNTAAFSVPPAGTFGTAGRNMIIGPGSRLLNAQVSRDIHLHATRRSRSR